MAFTETCPEWAEYRAMKKAHIKKYVTGNLYICTGKGVVKFGMDSDNIKKEIENSEGQSIRDLIAEGDPIDMIRRFNKINIDVCDSMVFGTLERELEENRDNVTSKGYDMVELAEASNNNDASKIEQMLTDNLELCAKFNEFAKQVGGHNTVEYMWSEDGTLIEAN